VVWARNVCSPYKLFQKNDNIEVEEDGTLVISQSIVTKSRPQMLMVIGKNGSVVERIRAAAEKKLTLALGCPVKLAVNVVVAGKRDAVERR
jgi:GTPase Era involved in 16S rRNA processing